MRHIDTAKKQGSLKPGNYINFCNNMVKHVKQRNLTKLFLCIDFKFLLAADK